MGEYAMNERTFNILLVTFAVAAFIALLVFMGYIGRLERECRDICMPQQHIRMTDECLCATEEGYVRSDQDQRQHTD